MSLKFYTFCFTYTLKSKLKNIKPNVCFFLNKNNLHLQENLWVVFGNLDLDLDLDLNLRLIDLKLRDFKSIDFRSYFKFKHFKYCGE